MRESKPSSAVIASIENDDDISMETSGPAPEGLISQDVMLELEIDSRGCVFLGGAGWDYTRCGTFGPSMAIGGYRFNYLFSHYKYDAFPHNSSEPFVIDKNKDGTLSKNGISITYPTKCVFRRLEDGWY